MPTSYTALCSPTCSSHPSRPQNCHPNPEQKKNPIAWCLDGGVLRLDPRIVFRFLCLSLFLAARVSYLESFVTVFFFCPSKSTKVAYRGDRRVYRCLPLMARSFFFPTPFFMLVKYLSSTTSDRPAKNYVSPLTFASPTHVSPAIKKSKNESQGLLDILQQT